MIIYKATNLHNNKIYIGQTIKTLENRKRQHIYDSTHGNRENNYFHNALAKYGETSFKFEVIDTAQTQQELDQKERFWIKYYNSTDKDLGYNLDSGGKSGGCKSQSTKDKIGETTKLKWDDPDTASRMMNGLRKGTDKWVQICRSKRVLFKCPYCGKEEYLPKWEAENKTACCKECKRAHGGFKYQTSIASKAASKKVIAENTKNKHIIGKDILKWCKENPQIIIDCPYNRITTCLEPILSEVREKYGISDIRSLFRCFDVSSRKDFLTYLKNYVKKL